MPETAPPQETSTVEEWRADIVRLVDAGAKPRSIYDWLKRERPNFTGTYPAVKRLCRRLDAAQGPREEDVVIPVDAPPGEAQVDFGYLGTLMACSRQMVTRVVFDQASETWIRLHVEAFEELGGVPTVIVPDNLKASASRAPSSSSRASKISANVAPHSPARTLTNTASTPSESSTSSPA